MSASPVVVAVHKSAKHDFRKVPSTNITLLAGLGVEGDAHCGVTVQHRFDTRKDPTRPNRRQVHLIQVELLDEVNRDGFRVLPGDLGENISVRGIDVLGLPAGTQLQIGPDAIVELTGLREPCVLIERFQKGLLSQMLVRDSSGTRRSKSGVMAIVVRGGIVRPGDAIAASLPLGEHVPLQII